MNSKLVTLGLCIALLPVAAIAGDCADARLNTMSTCNAFGAGNEMCGEARDKEEDACSRKSTDDADEDDSGSSDPTWLKAMKAINQGLQQSNDPSNPYSQLDRTIQAQQQEQRNAAAERLQQQQAENQRRIEELNARVSAYNAASTSGAAPSQVSGSAPAYSSTQYNSCVSFQVSAAHVLNRCNVDLDIYFCDVTPGSVYSCRHGVSQSSLRGGDGGLAQVNAGREDFLGANVKKVVAATCRRGDNLTEDGTMCRHGY
jgi:hypothetical protein